MPLDFALDSVFSPALEFSTDKLSATLFNLSFNPAGRLSSSVFGSGNTIFSTDGVCAPCAEPISPDIGTPSSAIFAAAILALVTFSTDVSGAGNFKPTDIASPLLLRFLPMDMLSLLIKSRLRPFRIRSAFFTSILVPDLFCVAIGLPSKFLEIAIALPTLSAIKAVSGLYCWIIPRTVLYSPLRMC